MLLTNCELIHALPPSSRRCFNRSEAASYVGVSASHFDKLVRNGKMPRPHMLLGRKVWDVKILDRFVDHISGLTLDGSDQEELDRELSQFEEKHGKN